KRFASEIMGSWNVSGIDRSTKLYGFESNRHVLCALLLLFTEKRFASKITRFASEITGSWNVSMSNGLLCGSKSNSNRHVCSDSS
ncbi:hypothetical protein FCV25MIE_01735, partial [Fagus crenata]